MTLNDIASPADIKGLPDEKLATLAFEIRKFLVSSISETGGHLASNLGVVELTLALHSVFDFSTDRLIWDVGHQAYVHKILTGRKDKFSTLRQFGGLSGFPKTSESIYDAFNTGHASTSVSAALGMARARDLARDNYEVVAVFGDGALTGGLLFEGLNDAGHSNSKVIFVLNDNEMSIAQNVGALAKYLQRLRRTKGYFKSKDAIEDFLGKLPIGADAATVTAKKLKGVLRQRVLPPTMFDNLGLNYFGPIDGHDISGLKTVFERAKQSSNSSFIHVQTKKGKGYRPAELNPQQYHGVSGGKTAAKEDYSAVFGKTLCRLAETNSKIVAITGAMPLGTGLSEFSKKYSNRYFDVGIAEEHAVTMAAGLAIKGFTPVVPLYSTFMQRAYDQILHDVCIQNLHVIIAIDRAGLVGSDGETHQGIFDISFLCTIPNMTLMAPKNKWEFSDMVKFAVDFDGPIAIRYPRGEAYDGLAKMRAPIVLGKSETLYDEEEICLIAFGSMVKTAVKVREMLKERGYHCSLINARFAKPLDYEMLTRTAKEHRLLVTLEENVKSGGFGEQVMDYLEECSLDVRLLNIAISDEYVEHGNVNILYQEVGIDAESVVKRIIAEYVGLK